MKGKYCVIVDDICDGGRTFIELAKTLKEGGAQRVVLYVTHGIFSKGIYPLEKYIDEVYTTNSFPQKVLEYSDLLGVRTFLNVVDLI